jgi:hypothetical protein
MESLFARSREDRHSPSPLSEQPAKHGRSQDPAAERERVRREYERLVRELDNVLVSDPGIPDPTPRDK